MVYKTSITPQFFGWQKNTVVFKKYRCSQCFVKNKRLNEFKMNTTTDDLRFLKGNVPSSFLKKETIKRNFLANEVNFYIGIGIDIL